MARANVCCAQFWLRKLHGLTGFVFLGYFLVLHVRGVPVYRAQESRAFFLYAPLLFHGAYGSFIAWEARPNALRYPRVRNWMYVLQRGTGLFLVPFLLLHLGDVLWGATYGGLLWYRVVWHAGLLGAAFHLANGTFGTAIHWGVTIGPHSQRAFVGIGFAAFFALAGYGLYTLSQF